MSARLLLAAIVVVVALLLSITANAAGQQPPASVTPEESHRLLNLQRQVNGIPPLDFNATLVDGCDKHNNYMRLNGMGHGEDPARPGYTPEGAAPGAEVVSSGEGPWSEAENPWTTAPLHAQLLFHPELLTGGGANSHGFSCYRFAGSRDFAAPTFFSVPGHGRAGIPMEVTVRGELPYAPQELVGIPQGQTTGWQLLVYAANFEAAGDRRVSIDASLVGPGGPVELRVVDGRVTAPGGGHPQGGNGVLIPVQPLAPYATYTAFLRWTNAEGAQADQSFSFETAGRENSVGVLVEAVDARGRYRIEVNSDAPNPTLRLSGPGGAVLAPRLRDSAAVVSKLRPGAWSACVSSGGRDAGYQPAEECTGFDALGTVALRLARRLSSGRRVVLRVPRVARGRKARVVIRQTQRRCKPGYGCQQWNRGRAVVRRVRLRSPRMRLRVPRARYRDGRVRVSVQLRGFEHRDARYRKTEAKRSYR